MDTYHTAVNQEELDRAWNAMIRSLAEKGRVIRHDAADPFHYSVIEFAKDVDLKAAERVILCNSLFAPSWIEDHVDRWVVRGMQRWWHRQLVPWTKEPLTKTATSYVYPILDALTPAP